MLQKYLGKPRIITPRRKIAIESVLRQDWPIPMSEARLQIEVTVVPGRGTSIDG